MTAPDIGYLFAPLRFTRTGGVHTPSCPGCAAELDKILDLDAYFGIRPDRTRMPGGMALDHLKRFHANHHRESR